MHDDVDTMFWVRGTCVGKTCFCLCRFELRKTIPVAVQITNVTSKRVAFKVKTTSPKKYCVRPSHGFIEANSVKEVQVILQAQREAPSSFQKCKDKFLIQAAVVDKSVKAVNSELFDSMKSKDLDQVKLRVTMVPPAMPPSPVPEATEGSEAVSPTVTLGPTGAFRHYYYHHSLCAILNVLVNKATCIGILALQIC